MAGSTPSSSRRPEVPHRAPPPPPIHNNDFDRADNDRGSAPWSPAFRLGPLDIEVVTPAPSSPRWRGVSTVQSVIDEYARLPDTEWPLSPLDTQIYSSNSQRNLGAGPKESRFQLHHSASREGPSFGSGREIPDEATHNPKTQRYMEEMDLGSHYLADQSPSRFPGRRVASDDIPLEVLSGTSPLPGSQRSGESSTRPAPGLDYSATDTPDEGSRRRGKQPVRNMSVDVHEPLEERGDWGIDNSQLTLPDQLDLGQVSGSQNLYDADDLKPKPLRIQKNSPGQLTGHYTHTSGRTTRILTDAASFHQNEKHGRAHAASLDGRDGDPTEDGWTDVSVAEESSRGVRQLWQPSGLPVHRGRLMARTTGAPELDAPLSLSLESVRRILHTSDFETPGLSPHEYRDGNFPDIIPPSDVNPDADGSRRNGTASWARLTGPQELAMPAFMESAAIASSPDLGDTFKEASSGPIRGHDNSHANNVLRTDAPRRADSPPQRLSWGARRGWKAITGLGRRLR